MNPNYNLEEQRSLASRIEEAYENDRAIREDVVARLAELIIALDEWLSDGGRLPNAWRVDIP